MPQERRITASSEYHHSLKASSLHFPPPLFSFTSLLRPPSLCSLHHRTEAFLPPLSPCLSETRHSSSCCFSPPPLPGTALHGLFEEPCSVLAGRPRNLQVLMELERARPGAPRRNLGVDSHSISPRLHSQHFGEVTPSPCKAVLASRQGKGGRDHDAFAAALPLCRFN